MSVFFCLLLSRLPTTLDTSGALGLVRCNGQRSRNAAHSPDTCRNSIKNTASPWTDTAVPGSQDTVIGPPGVCTVNTSGGVRSDGENASPDWWDGRMGRSDDIAYTYGDTVDANCDFEV
jgi:hypothetical protein